MTEAEIRADEREKTVHVLAEAMQKFSPDLAAQLTERWSYARLDDNERLERLLMVLRSELID